MNLEKTIRSLELRGYSVKHFAKGEEAAAYLCEEVKDTSVGIGGCKTADQLGLYEKLSERNTVYWHWREPGMETLQKANAAPVYISSANAISEDGEILNIDGRGNRLAGQVFGNKKLYIVAGRNKIAPTYDEALWRARNVAGPKRAQQMGKKTPCAIKADRCYDCKSPDRICRGLVVLWGPTMGMPTEVVLIDEDLGN